MRTKTERKPWSRRKKFVLIGVLPAFLLAGTAAAAWLLIATGSTTSTDTTGTAGTGHVTVSATNRTTALTPGGPASGIPVTVTNTGTTPVKISSITVAVTGTSAGAACTAKYFSVTQGTFTIANIVQTTPFTLPAGKTAEAKGTTGVLPTIKLKGTAPTTCQSVTVNLSEKAS